LTVVLVCVERRVVPLLLVEVRVVVRVVVVVPFPDCDVRTVEWECEDGLTWIGTLEA
jgi:hypothetical protein